MIKVRLDRLETCLANDEAFTKTRQSERFE
jgi:hypothetical protein